MCCYWKFYIRTFEMLKLYQHVIDCYIADQSVILLQGIKHIFHITVMIEVKYNQIQYIQFVKED